MIIRFVHDRYFIKLEAEEELVVTSDDLNTRLEIEYGDIYAPDALCKDHAETINIKRP